MKSFILLIIGIIAAVLVVGGVTAIHFMNEMGINVEDIDSSTVDKVMDKVSNIPSSDGSDSSGKSVVDDASDIVSEEVKFNHLNGGGYFREVTYKDGGFRQFDTETGDLIGSSYESDQDKFPSRE